MRSTTFVPLPARAACPVSTAPPTCESRFAAKERLSSSSPEAAGRAFQLADDLLDVTASPDAVGKATGKDADAGKQTLVARVGVETARRHLGTIVHDAITALTPFGPEADTLRETARYFAMRES